MGGAALYKQLKKNNNQRFLTHHLNGHLPIRQVLPSHPTGAEKIGSSFGDCNFLINYSEELVFFDTAKNKHIKTWY